MTVEVFAIRCYVETSAGQGKYAYLSSAYKTDDGTLMLSVCYKADGKDTFDEEIRERALKYFSRRQALNVRDYVVSKLSDEYSHATFDVIPQIVGFDIAAKILTQPQLDTSC